jgi:DNA-binding CsgD family transcriptional regulator
MNRELQKLTTREVGLLFGIFNKLSRSQNPANLRREIANDLLTLLKSDFLASFIWNPLDKKFDQVIFQNMTRENLKRYETYYQFHDPITPALQKRRKATLVGEVMSQKELEKTEFFNDFLMRDGLHHGINLYAYDGDLNIGDLRIWRTRHRPDFGRKEAALLDLILPHFRNSLRNVRALSQADERARQWPAALENAPIALFIFDSQGRLVHRNDQAHSLKKEFAPAEYLSFFQVVNSLIRMDLRQTHWGPFFLSALRMDSGKEAPDQVAVLAYGELSKTLGSTDIRLRYRLSPREAEICLLVCKGLTDLEIASVLSIQFSTVRTHLKHIFAKTDATNRSELIFNLLEGVVDFRF